MAKREQKSVDGHSIEDLYANLREGRALPSGMCLDFDKDPPFFSCPEGFEPEAPEDAFEVAEAVEG